VNETAVHVEFSSAFLACKTVAAVVARKQRVNYTGHEKIAIPRGATEEIKINK